MFVFKKWHGNPVRCEMPENDHRRRMGERITTPFFIIIFFLSRFSFGNWSGGGTVLRLNIQGKSGHRNVFRVYSKENGYGKGLCIRLDDVERTWKYTPWAFSYMNSFFFFCGFLKKIILYRVYTI